MKNENSKQSHDVAIGDQDKYYFYEGKHIYAYNFMGAHKTHENGVDGIRFTTQAPNTKSICVIGDFSHWKIQGSNYMSAISEVGL